MASHYNVLACYQSVNVSACCQKFQKSFKGHFGNKHARCMHIVRLFWYHASRHIGWIQTRSTMHDLNPDHAWSQSRPCTLELHGIAFLECMLSNCNWVNQAQLRQPWSFTVYCFCHYICMAMSLHCYSQIWNCHEINIWQVLTKRLKESGFNWCKRGVRCTSTQSNHQKLLNVHTQVASTRVWCLK